MTLNEQLYEASRNGKLWTVPKGGQSVFVIGTATTTDVQFPFSVSYIDFIANDGDVTLYIGFDVPSTDPARLVLYPREVLSGLPVSVSSYLHVSCQSSTCNFRALGVSF